MSFNLRPERAAPFKQQVRLLAALGLLLTAAPSGIFAQTPLGGDFQINQTSLGYQGFPVISAGPNGFAVVWDQEIGGSPDPSGVDTLAATMTRGLSPAGQLAGSESPVVGPDRIGSISASVGIAPNGNKLVVWSAPVPQGLIPHRWEVFGSLYDPAGNLIFEKRRINTYEPGDQSPHGVAADGDSNFIVVWESDPMDGIAPSQDGSGHGVYARRIASSGAFLGPEFRVNTYTRGDQWPDGIAAAPDGRFVIVWTSVGQDGSLGGIYGQLYDATGRRTGPEFRVNQYTRGWQQLADVAMDRWGNFVAVWQSQGQDGSSEGVYARRFRADGRPRGGEWRVKSSPLGAQEMPRVAMDPAGDFVVAWTDWYSGPGFPDIMIRAFWADGRPVKKEIIANSEELGEQDAPDVAIAGDGMMVVVWQDNLNETPLDLDNGTGIFGRRFTTPFRPR